MPRLNQNEIEREIFETARECDLEKSLPTVSDRQGDRHRVLVPINFQKKSDPCSVSTLRNDGEAVDQCFSSTRELFSLTDGSRS